MSELIELLKCESWDLYHEELIIPTEGCSCSQLLESDLLVGVAVPIRNALLCLEDFPTGHPTKRREAWDTLQQFWSLEELRLFYFTQKGKWTLEWNPQTSLLSAFTYYQHQSTWLSISNRNLESSQPLLCIFFLLLSLLFLYKKCDWI